MSCPASVMKRGAVVSSEWQPATLTATCPDATSVLIACVRLCWAACPQVLKRGDHHRRCICLRHYDVRQGVAVAALWGDVARWQCRGAGAGAAEAMSCVLIDSNPHGHHTHTHTPPTTLHACLTCTLPYLPFALPYPLALTSVACSSSGG